MPSHEYKNRKWHLIDCSGLKLGRLATVVSGLLNGSGKIDYYPSVDTGDYVVLINADSVIVNPSSVHYLVSNPGRPGSSLKIRRAIDRLPSLAIQHAVKGMLPRNKTRKHAMKRLKIFNDENHVHQAQNPQEVKINNKYTVQFTSNDELVSKASDE